MTETLKLITGLQQAHIPVILVVAGIVFLFLALSGGISGKIHIPQTRQKWAGMLGSVLLLVGLVFSIPGLFQNPETLNGVEVSMDKSGQAAVTNKGQGEITGERGDNEYEREAFEEHLQQKVLAQERDRKEQLRREEEHRRRVDAVVEGLHAVKEHLRQEALEKERDRKELRDRDKERRRQQEEEFRLKREAQIHHRA